MLLFYILPFLLANLTTKHGQRLKKSDLNQVKIITPFESCQKAPIIAKQPVSPSFEHRDNCTWLSFRARPANRDHLQTCKSSHSIPLSTGNSSRLSCATINLQNRRKTAINQAQNHLYQRFLALSPLARATACRQTTFDLFPTMANSSRRSLLISTARNVATGAPKAATAPPM